jgi:hypothetical protein
MQQSSLSGPRSVSRAVGSFLRRLWLACKDYLASPEVLTVLLRRFLSGNAVQGISIKFDEPERGHVDHFVVAARSVDENFYRQRIAIARRNEDQVISPQALGLNPGDSFFVSVSAVDGQGHESLFAYPEVRCDSTSCAIPSYAFNVTAPLPPPPPAKDPAEDD